MKEKNWMRFLWIGCLWAGCLLFLLTGCGSGTGEGSEGPGQNEAAPREQAYRAAFAASSLPEDGTLIMEKRIEDKTLILYSFQKEISQPPKDAIIEQYLYLAEAAWKDDAVTLSGITGVAGPEGSFLRDESRELLPGKAVFF